jgi:beta-phosphoglucomutase-like phosphatase (HAD superfamily)
MLIQGVIFDMDGLMLDTEPAYRVAWQQASAECGYDLPDALYFTLVGRSRIESEQALVDALGPEFPLHAFRAACLRREADVFDTTPPLKKPGLDELLDWLDSLGVVKAVATSTVGQTAITQLAAAGLLDRFDVVATGDEVTNGKPAPDLFLLAAQRLGIEPVHCLVLEDAEAGVIAAHRAGMMVFMVPDLKPPSPEVKSLANGVFESLSAVARDVGQVANLRPIVNRPVRVSTDRQAG